LSSSDFSVSQNYCLDTDEYSFLLNCNAPEQCECCVEPPVDDCCKKNEIKILKINDHFISTGTSTIHPIAFPNLILPYDYKLNLLTNEYSSIDFKDDPPEKTVSRIILFKTILV